MTKLLCNAVERAEWMCARRGAECLQGCMDAWTLRWMLEKVHMLLTREGPWEGPVVVV